LQKNPNIYYEEYSNSDTFKQPNFKLFSNQPNKERNNYYRDPTKLYYNNYSYTFIEDIENSSFKTSSNENNSIDKNNINKNYANFPFCFSKDNNKKNIKEADGENIISNNFKIFSGFQINKISLCSSCFRWKLPRTHHCRSCGKCILKMDHHCPWLANCIGFKNYKYFCLVIFYGFILSMIIFLTFWEVVINYLYSSETGIISTTLICVCYSINFGLLIFVSYLFNYNLSLVFANETIIERADKERFSEGLNIKFDKMNTSNSISYDKGNYKNFTEVFGSNPLLWFLPYRNNEEYIKCFVN